MEDQNAESIEYERRFLVQDLAVLDGLVGDRIDQGYMWARDGYAIRVRVTSPEDADSRAVVTLKGPRIDASRLEVENDVPLVHGKALLELCNYRVTKVRYPLISSNEAWVVDAFDGANEGLVIAEFEASKKAVGLMRPPWWAGPEVTDDRRYDNENLARDPWSEWPDAD